MENIRSSKQNKINTSVISFSEGKINCPKKSTDDKIHLQNVVLLFTAYKRIGTKRLLTNINKNISRCKRRHLRKNHPTLCFCLLNKKETLDIHTYRCACLIYVEEDPLVCQNQNTHRNCIT